MDRAKLLEYIAAALHRQAGLDNQSTTTAGFCDLNKTLYITSQQNKHYQDLLSVAGAGILEAPATQTSGPKKLLVYLHDQQDRQALSNQSSIKKRTFNEDLKTILRFRLGSVIQDNQEKLDFEVFLSEINSIKVVLDQDLYIRSEHQSGFHGEARIVRFLYIKYLKRITFEELTDPSRETVKQFEKDFKERYGGRLWMGSSQGACLYCAWLMAQVGTTFTTTQVFTKDRGDTWRHPLTTTTGEFPKPVAAGLLAPVAVARSGHKGPKTNKNEEKKDGGKMEIN